MPKPSKKDDILLAGFMLMYERGFNATGIQEITGAAGLPKGSFYNYFSSKEEFAFAALDVYDAELQKLRDFLKESPLPPAARIRRFYEMQIRTFKERFELSRGCFASNFTLELADTQPKIAARAEEIFRENEKALQRCLMEAEQAGELRVEASPAELAANFQNGWSGALLRMKSSRTAKPLMGFRKSLEFFLKD